VQESVKLDVGNTFSMTVRLNVAGVAETVQVSENTYQTVNTETANVETLISGTQVTELALNGRNWAQLINLAPGTSSLTNDTQQGTNVRIDDTAINGLRRRTAPTLDGASNVDHGSVGTQVNNISVDAIQEFKLVSSPYSAEYGAQAGPAVNVVTKRGTTEFHGSVFEFFRHDALNAYSWESKQRAEPEKPQLRFNNFGGFVGGPAYKQKLFFFGGMEFKRPRTGRSLNEIVPTEAMRRGDVAVGARVRRRLQRLPARGRAGEQYVLHARRDNADGDALHPVRQVGLDDGRGLPRQYHPGVEAVAERARHPQALPAAERGRRPLHRRAGHEPRRAAGRAEGRLPGDAERDLLRALAVRQVRLGQSARVILRQPEPAHRA
jgi:hypothetical protein